MERRAENMNALTVENTDYRRVHETSHDEQLVFMSISPGETIPKETHEHTTQLIRVEKGDGKIIVNGETFILYDDAFKMVHRGQEHEVINTSKTEDLKLYTIYSPPHHPRGLVQRTQPSEGQEREEKEDYCLFF